MPTYKNIRIKKRGGGTRLQRVQVLASGKYKFVKNKKTSSSKSNKKSKNRNVKKSGNGKRKITIPISLVAPLIITATKRMPSGSSFLQNIQKGDWNTLGYNLTEFVGIEAPTGKFRLDYLINSLMPFVGGFIIHKVAGYLGINRWLGRSGIPFIRI